MNLIELRLNQLKSLIALLQQRDLPCPFGEDHVDDMVQQCGGDENRILRTIGHIASIVHEILYAPPRK